MYFSGNHDFVSDFPLCWRLKIVKVCCLLFFNDLCKCEVACFVSADIPLKSNRQDSL